jgi:hypothetical protein
MVWHYMSSVQPESPAGALELPLVRLLAMLAHNS